MTGSSQRRHPTSQHISPRLTQLDLQRLDFALQMESAALLSSAPSPG